MASEDKEQAAPQQQTLESEPLAKEEQKGYGTYLTTPRGFESPEHMDAQMPKKMRDICNKWIVATYQFDEMENAAGALTCARVLRVFLIFFIVTSTFGLCMGFILKASLAAPMESEQYASLSAPSVVVCPSPWGTDFEKFEFQAADRGLVPGNNFNNVGSDNYTVSAFDSRGGEDSEMWTRSCKTIELKHVMLSPQGKVAQYTAFDTIRLTFNAKSEDGNFNFGFFNGDNRVPQRWYYASLGKRTSGEISYDQVNVGASEVSEGTPRSILNFGSSGSVSSGSETQLEYFYGYFMVRVLSAQAKGITLFAVVAFVLLVAASINNCGLFELFFVEFVPDDEPAPSLVPNLLCQAVCGQYFHSCRRRKQPDAEGEGEGDPEADPKAEADPAEAPPVEAAPKAA